MNLTDDTLKEIAREGRYSGHAAEHLYQMAAELKATASWAEVQYKAAILLAPETADPGEGWEYGARKGGA
jgi:hypothetical protein